MSWLKEWWPIVVIIIIGATIYLSTFGFFIHIDREREEFCELHNLEHEHLGTPTCFEIRGNEIIEYPIKKHEGRYYFMNEGGA